MIWHRRCESHYLAHYDWVQRSGNRVEQSGLVRCEGKRGHPGVHFGEVGGYVHLAVSWASVDALEAASDRE